jgi:hypothetical protein
MPRLKTVANYFQGSTVCNMPRFSYQVCTNGTTSGVLNPMVKIRLKHLLNSKYDLYELKLTIVVGKATSILWH